MNLLSLSLLEAIVRTGSYSGAAKEKNFSVAKVSFHINNLQDELNLILFEKVGRQMRLTKDGEKVLEEARKILEATEKISSMKGGSPRLTGNLGIAVNETLLQYRLVNVINNFRQMAPDVTIKVELGTAYSIKDMVLRSEVDLAVSFNMGSYESPLTALPLCSEELGLFGSPRLKIEKEQFFLPNHCPNLNLLTWNFTSGPFRFFKRFLDKRGICMGKDMQVSSRNIINTFLESGFGVAYLPKVSVEREVEEGRICEIQTALPKIDLGVILLKNSNHAESSAASLFSKLVKNELYDGKMDRSDFFSRTCLKHRTPNEC